MPIVKLYNAMIHEAQAQYNLIVDSIPAWCVYRKVASARARRIMRRRNPSDPEFNSFSSWIDGSKE